MFGRLREYVVIFPIFHADTNAEDNSASGILLNIIEQNYIFGSTHGYSKIIARIEKNYVFEGFTSYKVLYRIENNLILEGINSYKLLGRIDGDKVLEGLSTYKILYRIERR